MDKKLLIKDLCARLPCGVQGITSEGVVSPLLHNGEADWDILTSLNYRIIKFGWRPYLRQMSSMTENERNEYREVVEKDMQILENSLDAPITYTYADGMIVKDRPMFNEIDWLNAHHFDYRGLICKELALEAPEGMYNF